MQIERASTNKLNYLDYYSAVMDDKGFRKEELSQKFDLTPKLNFLR